jgi:hypothetical protein
MSNKKKKRTRALSKKLGISYQGADNVLRAHRGTKSGPTSSDQPPERASREVTPLRAVNAISPAAGSDGRYQIRPFEEIVDGCRAGRTSRFTGRIEGNTFVVSVFGADLALSTAEVGRDKRGAYAIVLGADYPLADGFSLTVDIEPDEDGMHGCELRVGRREGNWTDPTSGFSVYFGAAGVTDGRSGAVARTQLAPLQGRTREQAYEDAAVGRLLHDDSEADEDGFVPGAGFDRYGGFPGNGLS